MAYESQTRINEVDTGLIEKTGSMWTVDRVAGGSALTLVNNRHAGKTILLDTAAGTTITLPTATGSNVEYEFVTSVIATSGSHKVQVPDATTYMTGALTVVDNADGTATTFGTTGSTTTRSDTITLNRSTTGSVAVGERFFAKDVATGYWAIRGVVVGTGSEATPFSAAV